MVWLEQGASGAAIFESSPLDAPVTLDYTRHGTTTLFATLDVKSGLVIGECMPRHRAREFLSFLRRIDRAVRNHATIIWFSATKRPTRRPRCRPGWKSIPIQLAFHTKQHILVEHFFGEIAKKRICRGCYSSVYGLEAAIYD